MLVFTYVLIFFITACGPQTEESPESNETSQKQTSTTQIKKDNTETTPPSSVDDSLQTTADENQAQQNIAPPKDNTPLLQEPHLSSTQLLLNKMRGAYQFPLDVYQYWISAIITSFYDDALVTVTLAPNPRPQTEQMLIEAVSSQDPFGKFCVVQSNFNVPAINGDENPEHLTDPIQEGRITDIEALHSFSNEGSIVDMDNVKNTIKINTDEPLSFTLEFYGSRGAESVEFNAEDAINDENTTLDFDSLCRSCGFEIGQNNLCQEKIKGA